MLGDSTRPVFLSPGFWWIATALLSTYAVVDAHLGHLTSVFERVAVAVPLGWAVSSWLAYLFASLRYQTLDVRSVRAAWLVQAAIGLFHVWLVQRRRKAGHEPAGTMRDSPARSAKVAPHRPGMGVTAYDTPFQGIPRHNLRSRAIAQHPSRIAGAFSRGVWISVKRASAHSYAW
jgi:hypothetical protein